ncbi:ribosome recycling factor [Candidatus Mesenet endosymbiont of Agriotes lineatus]|uniref:ribosome recycling factor n=1 Tax=Candidatus Mesenet endosymbiont of Agriotes lineatus TaxID=3077948 RepID=UPI0030CB9332
MLDNIKNTTKERMEKTIEVFSNDIKGVRTGKANPSFLDGITVDIYNGNLKLNQVASASVVDNKTLSINVWDASVVGCVKNAILNSNLGLNPVIEGSVIRVTLPELTEESRKKFIKLVNEFAENAKVAIRNIRRDIIDKIKSIEKNKEVSEDDARDISDQIQKITNDSIGKIEKLLSIKEQEILKI